MRAKELVISKKRNNAKSGYCSKRNQGCFYLQHVEGGREFQSRMVLGEKRIQVVITYGVRDKVRQGMLLSSNCVYRNYIFICWYTHLCCAFHINRSMSLLDRYIHPFPCSGGAHAREAKGGSDTGVGKWPPFINRQHE